MRLKEWQTLVCVDDWSNVVVVVVVGGGGSGSSGVDGVVRRGWGALVLGTNQYLTGGKRTDGKKAAWQPSAIPHRLILCCARTCFSSSSIPIRVLYCFILLHRRVSSSLFGRPALTRAPFAPSPIHQCCILYKCSAPTETFTLKKQLFN